MAETVSKHKAVQAHVDDDDDDDGTSESMEKELAFYMSYHSNKTNQLIHFIFIPQILWSSLILLAFFNFPGFTYIDLGSIFTFRPNGAMVLALVFQIWYIILNEVVGVTYLPIMTTMYLTATHLVNHVPEWLPWRYAFGPEASALPFGLAVFFNGWFWQFLGHFVYEGRAPALFDNLTQALVTAPFFVHIEALFFLFNWRPSLHKRIRNLASQRIVAMNKEKREKSKKVQ
ncbi:hypothetical protein CcaverHIS002_0304890 [Cutaneotrichosporon cavernicola]|uniref:DUF962-domain-containing protein n=1 Tax=Cutaneotrichosporon cavernicola TaxID=279322 RepID=A0AA48I9P6_9TREE|nr:uncharacterized protein CcaverHIS019_0304850 [Cutaneotrichosporon cavernicola]BEI82621.1 hypothetical protein CcaverHIS002_0304890 [Cutaneotrichosporon cavernicola]BEI90415.1 hypothetical protein CcaverHIS019_0304850 [Cutaneotrichosporon cavernicola]BEI98190.1 hypothetical protein CcaverHIS631_0304890 [Cutaneotrichosporon cavernicola]BEJ05966.1 hypothetical protein CcaverHIS641_0304880 [Cutaneotrichosporon cavernicola]